VSRGGESNEYAERGDRIHDLVEANLAGNPMVGNMTEIGVAIWMADKTRELLDSVEAVAVRIEVKDPLSGEVITFGTGDCWGYSKLEYDDENPMLTIIDWKTGFVADYTAQVSIYALGMMDQLKVDVAECIIVYGDQQKIERITVYGRMQRQCLLIH
jgi:hypothetical protein